MINGKWLFVFILILAILLYLLLNAFDKSKTNSDIVDKITQENKALEQNLKAIKERNKELQQDLTTAVRAFDSLSHVKPRIIVKDREQKILLPGNNFSYLDSVIWTNFTREDSIY